MMECMVEVEDVDIARPVDDMKKMKDFTLSRAQWTELREGERGFRQFRQFRYEVVAEGCDLGWASIETPSDREWANDHTGQDPLKTGRNVHVLPCSPHRVSL